MLAQTVSIPENPTLIFFFCLSIAVGGPAMIGLMALSMKSQSKAHKEASDNSNTALGRFIDFCKETLQQYQSNLSAIGAQNEANISRICKTHEKVGDGIIRELRETRGELSRQLNQIHIDIKQKEA